VSRRGGNIVTGAGKYSNEQKTRTQETEMSDHKHGEMDTKVQEDTFSGFMTWVTRTTIVIILALIFVYMVNG
jgi:hypothetical protein